MVAVIKTGNSIRRGFYYNENKVEQGVAECIMAGNYPSEPEELSQSARLNMLLRLADLNQNVRRSSVHISLNFDPSENPDREQLQRIAQTYMDKIGFGEQPFLVYRHHDAAHPHIHILSVKVRPDGTRIETQNIGRNLSEKARREIEQIFGLVKADERKQENAFQLQPVNVVKALYGKSETKQAIGNVLNTVLEKYRYTSLPELNAVLRQYNVSADRGNENSRVYKGGGLVYRILDQDGKPVGVPIKASDFYSKPTLKYLEEKFVANQALRIPHKTRIKNAIDLALKRGEGLTLTGLVQLLAKQGIHTVLRQNPGGLIYGITYVDHRTRCVFNGSDLGKSYSAKAIQERLSQAPVLEQKPHQYQSLKAGIHVQSDRDDSPALANNHFNDHRFVNASSETEDVLKAFTEPMPMQDSAPFTGYRRKKRKKRGLSIHF